MNVKHVLMVIIMIMVYVVVMVIQQSLSTNKKYV